MARQNVGAFMNYADRIPECIRNCIQPSKVMVVVGLKDADVDETLKDLFGLFNSSGEDTALHTIRMLRKTYLFDGMSILDNLYMERRDPFNRRKKAIYEEICKLFDHFGLSIDPLKNVSELTDEEKKIIELLRAYIRKPDVMIMVDSAASLGFFYTAVFQKILHGFLENGCRIIYLCTKWEDVLRFGDYVAITYRKRLIDRVFNVDHLKENPRKIISLLAGIELDSGNMQNDDFMNAMNIIYRSSQMFIKNYELGDTLRNLSEALAAPLQADKCLLYLKEASGGISMINKLHPEETAYELKDSFITCFLEGREESLYLSEDDVHLQNCYKHAANDIRTTFLVAIISDGEKEGVVQLAYKRNFICSESQILIIKAACNEIGLMVEKSRLVNHSLFLRESHHRIKNNLQIVIGILYNLKAYMRKQGGVIDYFSAVDSIVGRIKSISAVHEMLSRDMDGGNVLSAHQLVDEVLELFKDTSIRIEKHVEEIPIVYNKATSVAMILHELVNNSCKHAFQREEKSVIRIEMYCQSDCLELTVSDNGSGLPDDFDIETASSVGMSIIRSLVQTMRGKIKFESNKGTIAKVSLPIQTAKEAFTL